MTDAVTILLLGGPRHGTTVEIPASERTVSFPEWDPPEARVQAIYAPGSSGITDASITRHDYDVTKLVDLDGAVVLIGVCREDPRPLRSLFPGSTLSVVDHRDRHPTFTPPRPVWPPAVPRPSSCEICAGSGIDYLGRPCRYHGDHR